LFTLSTQDRMFTFHLPLVRTAALLVTREGIWNVWAVYRYPYRGLRWNMKGVTLFWKTVSKYRWKVYINVYINVFAKFVGHVLVINYYRSW